MDWAAFFTGGGLALLGVMVGASIARMGISSNKKGHRKWQLSI